MATLVFAVLILQLITYCSGYHILITAPSTTYGHWNELNHVATEILSRSDHFITFIIDESKDKYLNAIRESYPDPTSKYQIIYIEQQYQVDVAAIRDQGALSNPIAPIRDMMMSQLPSLIGTIMPFLQCSNTPNENNTIPLKCLHLTSKMNNNLLIKHNDISSLVWTKKVDLCLLDQVSVLLIALCDAFDIPVITNSVSAVTAIKEHWNFWATTLFLNAPFKLNSYSNLINGTIFMSYTQRCKNVVANMMFIAFNKFLSYHTIHPILRQIDDKLTVFNRSLLGRNQQYNSGMLSFWNKAAIIESLAPPFSSISYVRPRVKQFGFLIYPPKELHDLDIIKWIESDNKPVLLISFGSAALFKQSTIQNLYVNLIQHSKQNKYKIIWALRQSVYHNISNDKLDEKVSNIKIMRWIPQLQLLLHPKIRLFLSHAGINGVLEGLYSQKLMILFPNAADQFFNAKRVQELECGKIIQDKDGFTDLSRHINTLLLDKESAAYHQNKIDLLHEILTRNGGVKEAADFVEYVAEFGTKHLLCTLGDKYGCNQQAIPWYQHSLIDIYFIFVLFMLTIAMMVRKCCYCLLFQRNANKQKTE